MSPEYHPGSCECGRTNTEVTWDESIFCGYCGTEVSMEILPRRYYLGYLPLALPIAHFWYYYHNPRPLPCLIGFSLRLFQLIFQCKRIVAEEISLTLKLQNQVYFSSDFCPMEYLSNFHDVIPFNSIKNTLTQSYKQNRKKLFNLLKNSNKKSLFYSNVLYQCNVVIPKVDVCTFPWYCLYRDVFFFLFPKKKKKRSRDTVLKTWKI